MKPSKNPRWFLVYSKLRDAIFNNGLEPGRKLPEDELAAIYDVNRAVIRAALQALAQDRLVRLEPNRGAFVAQPSSAEAAEVFEARSLVEPRVAELAASAAKASDVARLRRHLRMEHEAVLNGSESEALALSARFHASLAEIAGQTILAEFVRDLLLRSSLVIALYWKRHDSTCQSHAHEQLVDAIEAHQSQRAGELMREHVMDIFTGLDLDRTRMAGGTLSDILQ